MSNISVEANSWSLTSNEWNNIAENIPFSAICALKKEVQTGICQHGGMACTVMIGVDKSCRTYFVTFSDVVAYLESRGNKKPTEIHSFSRKKKEGCHLVANSTVNKFGPFSFLAINLESSPGLKTNPELTILNFQVPKQNLESEFEAYTFVGSETLKLKFVHQRGTGKFILSTKQKDRLELPSVLGAPIITENKAVRDKHLSSRWVVVGVMGLNEEFELCPYFVTADIFDHVNSASGSEGRDAFLLLASTSGSTDSKPVQTTSGDVEQLVSGIQLDTNGGGGSMSEIPSKIAVQPQSQTKKEGSRVELRCEVTGNELSYCWLKDGQVMEGQRGCCLVFEQVSMADFGSYVCQVKKKDQRCASEVTVAELDVTPGDGKSYTLLSKLPLDVEEMVGKELSLEVVGTKAWKFLADHYKMERTNINLLEKEKLPGVATIEHIKTVAPDLTVYNFCKTLKQHNIRRLDIVQRLKGHLSS